MSKFGSIPKERPKQDFPMIPAGLRTFRIADVEKSRKEGGDYPYYKVTLKVPVGDFKDRQVWDNLSLSPKQFCEWRIKQFCEAWYGGTLDTLDIDVGDNPQFDQFIQKAKGRTIQAIIEHEPSFKDKEKMIEKVVDYVPLEGGFPDTATGTEQVEDSENLPF